ncbi:hypothetical protein CDD83_4645 [Cordyceps sp. RAO-2017]|nr:hypothetical protein CDD83_4645 [Cordyceps sp. RAO-2017]
MVSRQASLSHPPSRDRLSEQQAAATTGSGPSPPPPTDHDHHQPRHHRRRPPPPPGQGAIEREWLMSGRRPRVRYPVQALMKSGRGLLMPNLRSARVDDRRQLRPPASRVRGPLLTGVAGRFRRGQRY